MLSPESILVQNKIIGVMLRDSRVRAGKTVQECAQALSCAPQIIAQAEEGSVGLSLPQLEVLAHFLGVPLYRFLGEEDIGDQEVRTSPLPYDRVMIVRRKIIGVLLRQARVQAGRHPDQLAASLGMTTERMMRIEMGEEPISMVELRDWAETLGLPFDTFIAEDVIPLTETERNARDLRRLAQLPSQIREFVLKPINVPYLQVAMNLSTMPAESLRQIASGLLEITY